jgi:hypothetical protein
MGLILIKLRDQLQSKGGEHELDDGTDDGPFNEAGNQAALQLWTLSMENAEEMPQTNEPILILFEKGTTNKGGICLWHEGLFGLIHLFKKFKKGF